MINYSDIKWPKKIDMFDIPEGWDFKTKATWNLAIETCEAAVKEAEKKMVLPPMKKYENYPATINQDWANGVNVGWNKAIEEIRYLNGGSLEMEKR